MQLALQRVGDSESFRRLTSPAFHASDHRDARDSANSFRTRWYKPPKCIDVSRHAIVLVCSSNAWTCVNLQTGCVSVSGNVTIQLSGNSSRATGEIIAALTNPRSTNDDVSSDASLSASMTPTVTVSSGATTMSSSGTGM